MELNWVGESEWVRGRSRICEEEDREISGKKIERKMKKKEEAMDV